MKPNKNIISTVRKVISRGGSLNLSCEGNVAALLELLGELDSATRALAAEYLGKAEIKKKSILGLLIPALRNETNSLAKVCIVESLGDLSSNKAIPMLTRTLDDGDELVRGYAADSLSKIGAVSSVKAIRQKLKLEKSGYAKSLYLGALHSLGAGDKTSELIKLLRSRRYIVRIIAAKILRGIVTLKTRKKVIVAMASRLKAEKKSSVKETLAKVLLDIATTEFKQEILLAMTAALQAERRLEFKELLRKHIWHLKRKQP